MGLEGRYFTNTFAQFMLDTIEYQNKVFPSRRLYLEGWGNVLISTCELQALLLNDSGDDFKDKFAELVDERIFYFVEFAQIRQSNKRLCGTLQKELNL